MKKFALIFFFLSISFLSFSQPFTFAHVTDTHVGGSTGAEDLQRTVADINSLPEVAFVLITGDVTEFGSREELEEAQEDPGWPEETLVCGSGESRFQVVGKRV